MGGCLSRVPCPGMTGGRQQIPRSISSVFYPSPSCLVLLESQSVLCGEAHSASAPPCLPRSPQRPSFCSHLSLSPAPLPRYHLGVTDKLPLTLQFLDPKLSSSAWTWVPLPDLSLLLSTVLKGPRRLSSCSSSSAWFPHPSAVPGLTVSARSGKPVRSGN